MKTILIAEDTIFMRLSLKGIIEGAGHRVLEAADGQEAVDLFSLHHPDLVIMDLAMPVMDGLSAIRLIKSASPDAKIVVCSAMDDKWLILEAFQAGARDFFVKPLRVDQVLAGISAQIGNAA